LPSDVPVSDGYQGIEPAREGTILQGDLFKWVDSEFSRPWRTYGIVVTADCDLILKKVRGVISYVPAFGMEDYVWHAWKQDRFDSIQKATESKLASRINKKLEQNGSSARVSIPAAVAWLQRVGIGGLITELRITDRGQINDFSRDAGQAKLFLDLAIIEKPDMALLKQCLELKNKTQAQDFSLIAKELQSSISSLPGDIFYLPMEHEHSDSNLFVMLRHIRQIGIEQIAISVADATVGNPLVTRLGRIAAPYRYAITQNLSRVFADIGLPSAYENLRDTSSKRFFGV
jgi:hypothetical protein